MTYLSKRKFIVLAVVFFICLTLLGTIKPSANRSPSQASSLSLEQIVSRRRSTRSYTSEDISGQQLLEVLWAAYCANDHRNVPQIGYDYPLIIFPVNETGSYQYIPENNSLVVHDLTVNKETIRPHDSGEPSDASVVLVVVWNQTKMDNGYFASAEAGCLVQNVYLAAASLDLGTCCVGSIDSGGLRGDLKLPSTLIPLLVMPLGYPTSPYPPASPNYDFMTGNLPPVQYSALTFEDAVRNMVFSQAWSAENLSLQELSQLLWAAYGYTNVTHGASYHRTTPSAYNIYPLVVYASNATGVYQYLPKTHSVIEVMPNDKKLDIANACSGQVWAAEAPAIFLVVYNSSYNGGDTGDGGTLSHEFIEVDAGAVIQQLFLEASAWNLDANIVSEGLEEWNGTGAEELRNILSLSSDLIPLYAIPVGHRIGHNLNIHVKDWDLIDDIQGAYVYKNSEWKLSDENGWANWTDVSGKVAIKVKWFGVWVNGPFTVMMDRDKTIDVRCNIFDIVITCVEGKQQALLQYVNATVFAGGDKIESGITGADGKTNLSNVPNGTLTFVAYDGKNNLIANVTGTITPEKQHETITCNENYVNSKTEWKIVEVWISVSFSISLLLPIVFIKFPDQIKCLKQRIKTMLCKQRKNGGKIK